MGEHISRGVGEQRVADFEHSSAVLDVGRVVIMMLVLKFLKVTQAVDQRFHQPHYLCLRKMHGRVVPCLYDLREALAAPFCVLIAHSFSTWKGRIRDLEDVLMLRQGSHIHSLLLTSTDVGRRVIFQFRPDCRRFLGLDIRILLFELAVPGPEQVKGIGLRGFDLMLFLFLRGPAVQRSVLAHFNL